MDKDEFFIRRIRELADIAWQRDIVTFSDFLDLNQQNMINSRRKDFSGVRLEFSGGYEHAERQMVAFHSDAPAFNWEFPIACLKAEPRAPKFSDALTHRDYLGAVMNLGIERPVTGDILIEDRTAFIFCHKKIADFLQENLIRVKHTDVVVSRVEQPEELPQPHLEEVRGTCSSVRLDSLISIAFGQSRSSMVAFIEGGSVFVNGKLITSNGYEPKEGDLISVRGRGRFRYDGVTGQTKKGRIGVLVSVFR